MTWKIWEYLFSKKPGQITHTTNTNTIQVRRIQQRLQRIEAAIEGLEAEHELLNDKRCSG